MTNRHRVIPELQISVRIKDLTTGKTVNEYLWINLETFMPSRKHPLPKSVSKAIRREWRSDAVKGEVVEEGFRYRWYVVTPGKGWDTL